MIAVSIIMPVYNKEKYVDRAIRSIINQNFTDWELIIVDDGSVDNSLQICKKYLCEKIKVISITNGGVSNARNVGLSVAKGEYITFIDSDDYVAQDYLEKLYKPQYDFTISGLTKISENGETQQKIIPNKSGMADIDCLCKNFYKEQLDTGIYGFVAGKCFRKSIADKYNIVFDTTNNLAEDYDFFLNLYDKVDNIFFMDYAGYRYLLGTDNSAIGMSDAKIDFAKQIEIQQKTKKFLEKHSAFDSADNVLYNKRIAGYIYTILISNKCKEYGMYLECYNKIKNLCPVVTVKKGGAEKIVLGLYNRNRYKLIFLLLKTRKLLGR